MSLLELPLTADETARLAAINDGITADGARLSTVAYSQRLTEYLRGRFRYSLKPNHGSGEGDPVVRWLEQGDRGHCELFSGAFMLLARQAGYPARMAVGFSGGAWNSVEVYFLVRNKDAHAWVEIYDGLTEEWLRVDPTRCRRRQRRSQCGGVDFVVGWSAWLDGLRIQWYRRIVNFDRDDQIEMAMTAGELAKTYAQQLKERVQVWMAGVKAWLAAPFCENLLQAGMLTVLGGLFYCLWITTHGSACGIVGASGPMHWSRYVASGKYLCGLKRQSQSAQTADAVRQASQVRAALRPFALARKWS